MRSRGQEQGQLMDGWLMDGRSRPALESEAWKISQERSLFSFSGDIASRTGETGQLPGRKPVAKHGPSLGSSLPHMDSPVAVLIQLKTD